MTERSPKTIVFVVPHLGLLRYFESSLWLLVERGHRLTIVHFGGKARDVYGERLAAAGPAVTVVRVDRGELAHWATFASSLRLLMDYVRYLDSRFLHASILKERVEEKYSPRFGRLIARPLRLFGDTGVRLAIAFLQRIEAAIPIRPEVRQFLGESQADLVLVSPLVDFGSALVDYVKAAQSLGIPTGLCVASWDNLTNKGHMRVVPDRVFVWNNPQKEEAIAFHGVPASSVVVTGAQLFDRFFDWRPERRREEFCRAVGLDPEHPFVIYLGSTVWVAPQEIHFVERWIRELRNVHDPLVAGVGIMIRPHPSTARLYLSLDISQTENVSVWPPFKRDTAEYYAEHGQREFFESLYYSAAAVGVNTSALIEAGIIGRTVCTLRVPEFKHSQEGTLHFAHLVDKDHGLLRVADDMEDHLRDLGDVLSEDGSDRERTLAFVREFVRPHGLDVPAAPILADAIEEAAELRVERRSARLSTSMLRVLLYPLAYFPRLLVRARKHRGTPYWVHLARPFVLIWVRLLVLSAFLQASESRRALLRKGRRARKELRRQTRRVRVRAGAARRVLRKERRAGVRRKAAEEAGYPSVDGSTSPADQMQATSGVRDESD